MRSEREWKFFSWKEAEEYGGVVKEGLAMSAILTMCVSSY
jgi:hypothetical protein